MEQDYRGRKIWIVGASSGIGRALAAELSARGAILALSARRVAELEALNAELGGGHVVITADAANAESMNTSARTVADKFPVLDGAVFMAGVYEPGPMADMDIAAAHRIVAVNLGGALNFIHAVLPQFTRQKRGQIALCASVAGYRGLPNSQPYSATKAAVISLAQSLRAEQKQNNIDVRVINPGFVRTPMTGKNDFAMPMMIEPAQAGKAIADGLAGGAFEIHFPKGFTYLMKFFALLPMPLFFWLTGAMTKGKS